MKLKASGLAEGTLRSISYSLAKLDKLCNLTDPEQVKLTIANMTVANSYKQNLIKAYNCFALELPGVLRSCLNQHHELTKKPTTA